MLEVRACKNCRQDCHNRGSETNPVCYMHVSDLDNLPINLKTMDLTRDQALAMMRAGYKVTHRYFCSDEYLYMEHGIIHSEEGYDFTEGWRERTGGVWDNGWGVYNKKTTV